MGLGSLALQADTQTVSGTAISSTNQIVDAASGLVERTNGMILYPWAASTVQFTAGAARGTRFVAYRPLSVTGIAFDVTTASTNAESVQVAIISTVNSGYTIHASSSYTSTLTTGTNTTSTGIKVLNFSSAFQLVPGTAYYAVISIGFTSGTGVAITSNAQSVSSHAFMGSTFGPVEAINATTSAALTTSTFGTGTTIYSTGQQVQLALRTNT